MRWNPWPLVSQTNNEDVPSINCGVMDRPKEDATQLLDDLRASMLSHLLVIGTTRFDIGEALSDGPLEYGELCSRFELQSRPSTVLFTAFRALGLIQVNSDSLVELTSYGQEKLSPASPYNLRGYIGLGAMGADVQNLVQCLENDAPAGDISFVFHEGSGPSALDEPTTSDALTRAMAARAANVAPLLPDVLDLANARHLLDVGGAHGLYSFELLQRNSQLHATIVDRQPPLRVAKEIMSQRGLEQRTTLEFGDIHQYRLPTGVDVVLMANILHDYSEDVAYKLVADHAQQLDSGGRMVILDAFLDAVPPKCPPISAGPRPLAAYSAMLFSICEGRCYRLDEYQSMLRQAGLQVGAEVGRLPAHGSVLVGVKS